jgi:microcystin-dependent protein
LSRNGSGTYTVPNTFVAGTAITASDHNENWEDVGDEITNSLAIDGQSTMTGQLKAANGTAAAPGITFGSDVDTGFYRASANDVGIAVNGSAVVRVNSTGMDVVSGRVREAGVPLLPAGAVIPYAGTTLPDGYLWPLGQVVSQTTYADLYAAVGTTYDTGGEGAGNFRMPDYRGRSLFGHDNPGSFGAAGRITSAGSSIDGTTLGASGGAQNVTIAQANLPNYTLPDDLAVTDVTGTVTFSNGNVRSVSGVSTVQGGGGVNNVLIWDGGANVTASFSATSAPMGGSVTSGGSGTALNKMPPAIICHFIIKY